MGKFHKNRTAVCKTFGFGWDEREEAALPLFSGAALLARCTLLASFARASFKFGKENSRGSQSKAINIRSRSASADFADFKDKGKSSGTSVKLCAFGRALSVP
jgi:hypothetical protein